jgi:hypothetical protein
MCHGPDGHNQAREWKLASTGYLRTSSVVSAVAHTRRHATDAEAAAIRRDVDAAALVCASAQTALERCGTVRRIEAAMRASFHQHE